MGDHPFLYSWFLVYLYSMFLDGDQSSDLDLEDLFWKQVIYLRRQNAQDEQAEADRYEDNYEQVCDFLTEGLS